MVVEDGALFLSAAGHTAVGGCSPGTVHRGSLSKGKVGHGPGVLGQGGEL